MTPYDDDAHVIARSLDDPEAFAIIFDRHHDAIFSYVAKRIGLDEAADVASDVFVTAFRKRASFKPVRPEARPWLFGIAARMIARHRTARTRRLRLLPRVSGLTLPSGPADTEVLERDEIVRRSRMAAEALETLSNADRETLLLRVWAELSYEEIAEALDVPVGTVRSRINRARKKIRELFPGSEEV